jgi:hypothetical protein
MEELLESQGQTVGTWVCIYKPFKEPKNRFPARRAGTTTLFVVPARKAT